MNSVKFQNAVFTLNNGSKIDIQNPVIKTGEAKISFTLYYADADANVIDKVVDEGMQTEDFFKAEVDNIEGQPYMTIQEYIAYRYMSANAVTESIASSLYA